MTDQNLTPVLTIGEPLPDKEIIRKVVEAYDLSSYGFDFTETTKIKVINSSAYSVKTKTFAVFDNELLDFDYIICAKINYLDNKLISEEVLILQCATVNLTSLEVIYPQAQHKRYRLPEYYFKKFTPYVEDILGLINDHGTLTYLYTKGQNKQTKLFCQTVSKLNSSDDNINKYDFVQSPNHYNNQSIESIEKVYRIWGKEATIMFCEITEFLYRERMGLKPGEDIQREMDKINWYSNKRKEIMSR
jgi:hypothetical protein